MVSHAGFAAVATVTEKLINDTAASFVKFKVGNRFFPLPQTVILGNTSVSFGGLVKMLPPRVELHANPGNLVRVHFSFQSHFRGQVSGQPVTVYNVQLSGFVDLSLTPLVQNNNIILAINLNLVNLQPLNVTRVSGPALPGPILAALRSTSLARAATAYIRSLTRLPLTPPTLPKKIWHLQPGYFKQTNFSEFDWFHILLEADRIIVKPLEQAINIAIDFAGFTRGDPNQLVDLTRLPGGGSVYQQTVTQNTNLNVPPILVRGGRSAGGSIAISVNLDMLAAVISRQVSPQISGTPITPDVKLDSIGISYTTFNKPLRGEEDALAINFQVTLRNTIQVSGRFLFQAYKRTWDGPTGFIGPDVWLMNVAKAEVELPFWVDASLLVLSIFFGAAIPVLAPFLWLGTAILTGDAIPNLMNNVANKAKLGMQSGLNGVLFPPSWSELLLGPPKPHFDGNIRYLGFTPSSIDLALNTWVNWHDLADVPAGKIHPDSWSVFRADGIPLRLELSEELEKLTHMNLMVSWEVRRADTNQVVATSIKSYLDPNGNGPLIPHRSEELYLVEAYKVRALATITLGSQVGEIWSGEQTISIDDPLNRRHKYLRWGPKQVYFKNAGTDDKWWSHTRRSRIHRTAVTARCEMLRQESEKIVRHPGHYITYSDQLPFDWEDMNNHRKVLCEYCFFGGPDKTDPYPKEDWFMPLHELVKTLTLIDFKIKDDEWLRYFR